MVKNKTKANYLGMPVEEHNAAAWADIESSKPVSNVTVPSEIQVRNAKEYVDTNEK